MRRMLGIALAIAIAGGASLGDRGAYGQAPPNRALTVPGQVSPSRPGAAPNEAAAMSGGDSCSALLQHEKELTELLKRKIQLLEQRLAKAEGGKK